MSETQVRTQVVSRPLALAELKTTRWVASQTLVKTALAALRPRYLALRQVALLGWFIVFYETMVVWWWSFIHHLPWPQLLLSLLHRADAALVHFLDFAQRKMEWVSAQIPRLCSSLRQYLSQAGLCRQGITSTGGCGGGGGSGRGKTN